MRQRGAWLLAASGLVLALVVAWFRVADRGARDPTPAAPGPAASATSDASLPPAAREGAERVPLGVAAPVVLPAPPQGRLRIAGAVVDLDDCGAPEGGAPAAGVEVRVAPGGSWGMGGEGARAQVTDAQGRFAFELEDDGKRPSRWRLLVAGAPGLRHARSDVVFEEGRRARDDLRLARCPLGTLRGTAEDTSGAPLEGVRVRFGMEPDVVEAFSDAAGRFELEGARDGWEVGAEKSGWSLVERTGGGRDAEGNWQPVRLVFAREAGVFLRALDAAGRGRAGESISAIVAPEERFGAAPGRGKPFDAHLPGGKTDALGVLLLEGLPAGLRLELHHASVPHARVLDGRLLAEDSREPGEPLVLRPGEVRELELRLGAGLRVSGRVTMPDGRPAGGAQVKLSSLEPDPGHPQGWSKAASADEEGRFAFDVAPVHPAQGLELLAQAGEDGRLDGVFFGMRQLPDPLYVARVQRHWPAGDAASWEVDLALERGGTLRGLVLDEHGAPTAADAELTSQDGSEPMRSTGAGSNGELRFVGLQASAYAVEVRKRGRATVVLRDLVPDAAPFTVRLLEPARARVVLRVVSEVELEQTIVLSGELRRRDAREVDAPDLPARLVVDGPFGWPASSLGLWYGAHSHSEERGQVMFGSGPIAGREKVFEVDGGLWWFGAKARAVGGNLLFPVGTDLVRVTPGEHVVELHLVPTGSVEGRFVGGAPPEAGWLALARPGGPPIPLDVRAQRLEALREPGADGSFLWPMVPEGPIELRWGRRGDLLAGRAAGVRALEVRRGETARVEIEP